MAKDTFYFSHDYNARTDIKIKRLIAKLGMTGYGIFWAIVEDLYNNANALPLDCESIAYDLRTDEQTIDMVINDFDLFVIEGLQFGSMSVQKRLDERAKKSNQARDNACKRWIKSEGDPNAMPPHSEPNAIKERKGKEKKERKGKESEAMPSAVLPFGDDFKAQWNIWKDFKKKQFRFVYASTESEQAAINHLVKLGGGIEQTAIAIIHQSMANGWKGFFELKNENNATTNNQRPFTNNSKRVFTADQLDPSGRLRGIFNSEK